MKNLLILFVLLLNINLVRATDLNNDDIIQSKPAGVVSSLVLKSTAKSLSEEEKHGLIQTQYSSRQRLWSISLPQLIDCYYSLIVGSQPLEYTPRVIRIPDRELIVSKRHMPWSQAVLNLQSDSISITLGSRALHPKTIVISDNDRMLPEVFQEQSLLNTAFPSQMNRWDGERESNPVAVLQLRLPGRALTLYCHEVKRYCHEVKSPKQIIQELVSKKVDYFGEELNNEIQKIREGKSFQDLTSIKQYLVEVPQGHGLKKKKKDKGEVTIFVKKEDDDRGDVEGFKRALLGAAYFPEELDPRTKSSSLVSLANFTFIHRQLADALFYGHPLARKYLKEIVSICNVPLENNDFYNEFYHIPDSDLGNYNRYLLPITARSATIEVVQEGDINQEITFPSYSKEIADYFSDLIKQNPEERRKKLKRL